MDEKPNSSTLTKEERLCFSIIYNCFSEFGLEYYEVRDFAQKLTEQSTANSDSPPFYMDQSLQTNRTRAQAIPLIFKLHPYMFEIKTRFNTVDDFLSNIADILTILQSEKCKMQQNLGTITAQLPHN